MTNSNIIFVPFDRKLYDNIVRLSNGKYDPAHLALTALQGWLETGGAEYDFDWGENYAEALELFSGVKSENASKPSFEPDREQAPTTEIEMEGQAQVDEGLMRWGPLQLPTGTKLRMEYQREHYFASVEKGKISFNGAYFTPSTWASRVANGTSRNAWRDVEIYNEKRKSWELAALLRDRMSQKRV
jgi:hypothetical protein